jgi:hypothetical protein
MTTAEVHEIPADQAAPAFVERLANCRARCARRGVSLRCLPGEFVVGCWGLSRSLATLCELEAWLDRWAP